MAYNVKTKQEEIAVSRQYQGAYPLLKWRRLETGANKATG